jgi:hypothetical protein
VARSPKRRGKEADYVIDDSGYFILPKKPKKLA